MGPFLLPEPTGTAAGLAVAGLLMGAAVIFSRGLVRRGVPVLLLFLLLGMLAGSEGVGGIAFEDYGLAFRIGTIALVFILFDGGLNTPIAVVRSAWAPAGVLATLGVALTTGGVGLAGMALGFRPLEALLMGAVVASTDAAAVFSVLRGSGVQLQQRVAATVELESGLNDPMAVILTLGLTEALVSGAPLGAGLVLDTLLQLAVGAGVGLLVGRLGRRVLRRPMSAGGLYPVLSLSLACLAYGLATLAQGSGFLAVYLAGLVLGNGPLPYRAGIQNAHDFLAWSAQVLMFLTLGLLAFPSQLLAALGPGLVVVGALALLVRPLTVLLCLLPFRYSLRECGFVGWVGLRGAVPIILASWPMMAGAPQAHAIFNIVFFVVVVGALVQGSTVRPLARRLGLELVAPPPPPASVELSTALPVEDEIHSFFVAEGAPACDKSLAELRFPEGAAAMMIVRGTQLIAPKGGTVLRAGDHVSVFCKAGDRERVLGLFGG